MPNASKLFAANNTVFALTMVDSPRSGLAIPPNTIESVYTAKYGLALRGFNLSYIPVPEFEFGSVSVLSSKSGSLLSSYGARSQISAGSSSAIPMP